MNNKLLEYCKDNKLIIESNFSGFLFKIKDCHVLYNNLSNNPLVLLEESDFTKDINFAAIKSSKLKEEERAFLFNNSSNKTNNKQAVLTIANSNCNLNCSFCLNEGRPKYNFPSSDNVKSLLYKNPNIVTLEITGGEPTADYEDLISILEDCGNLVRYIFIYTNGLSLDQKLIDVLGSLNSLVRIIIAADTYSDNSHIDILKAIEIVNSLEAKDNVKFSLNLICNSLSEDALRDYNIFISHKHNFETLKITNPSTLNILSTEDKISKIDMIKDLSKLIYDDKRTFGIFKGKSFQSLNYSINKNMRGAIDCNQNKLCVIDNKYINCIYTAKDSILFNTPEELFNWNESMDLCTLCEFSDRCKDIIGTHLCKAYNERCLLCPTLNTCHNKCKLRGELDYESCIFLMVQNAFEHWLNIKDMSGKELLESFNNTNLLPL